MEKRTLEGLLSLNFAKAFDEVRPLQLQADPPCSNELDSAATSDPEVQRTSANPRLHPGNREQSEQFCAVTQLLNGDGSDERRADEWRRRNWDTTKEDGEDQEGGGVLTTDDPRGDTPNDWNTRTSGAGGTKRKLRPRLGKIVASSGDRNRPGGYMNSNIQAPVRQKGDAGSQ
ncbi:hypothetical protein NDU88_009218 [Pleurodeles waltl]|uniref:Uncharacterized protein n=1 Tax=Pleurodeles waltl TaxID=8319 RepID=A0AAV7PYE1_PLEWA|nr:hypothetical protein NDU88_009218 [Pleurodeles waltl]